MNRAVAIANRLYHPGSIKLLFRNMSTHPNVPSLTEVVEKLNKFAPLSLAEKWDNVGLLIEPQNARPVNRILLTNDLTERVMQEALDRNSDLIISYHPPIFAPLKRITQSNWKERIVSKCLENRIALYSPHTAWDAVQCGVNDWLAKFVPIESSKPILPNLEDPEHVGAGRIVTISDRDGPLSMADAIDKFKRHIKINRVNVALGDNSSLETPIKTIALCAGSGASVLKGVVADLYITGEMSHHDVLDAVHRNVSVIACNHSNSERGFLSEFKETFGHVVGFNVEIVVAESDADPLLVR